MLFKAIFISEKVDVCLKKKNRKKKQAANF